MVFRLQNSLESTNSSPLSRLISELPASPKLRLSERSGVGRVLGRRSRHGAQHVGDAAGEWKGRLGSETWGGVWCEIGCWASK